MSDPLQDRHRLAVLRHAEEVTGNVSQTCRAAVVEPCAPRATVAIRPTAYGLSRREAEVARLVRRGSSTRAISAALHISPHTVRDHLKNVFDKLGVRSRRDLVGLMLGG